MVLASASPRRHHLLVAAGFEVVICPADVEEIQSGLPARDLVLCNALMKAESIASGRHGELVIGADTVVVLDGEILGKPDNLDQAAEMLSKLGGRVHEVLTGVCLIRGGNPARCQFVESTRVSFRSLDAATIASYVREINPLDKAGSYSAQEDDGRLIERVEGSFENVIGLPVEQVIRAIENHFTEPPAG